jgi:pseudouridylate synthase
VPRRRARRRHPRQLARGGTLTAFVVGDEVRDALREGRGVVALETSVIGQGLPIPQNKECVSRMDREVREHGAVPAWIGVIDGSLTVGLTPPQLDRFTEPGAATKVARRDLPVAVARGDLGATTVSATIWAAAKAGIEVAATGGIGGVHPGEQPDVSADLLELARNPGLLVCSGPKSIIDPVATVERLEELGVAIVGFGTDQLPFFLASEAPVDLEHRVDSPAEAAAILRAATDLGTRSTILLCRPIRSDAAMEPAEVAAASREAERRADRSRVEGKARTPFLLAALAELTEGRSLQANLTLLEDNAALAGAIAALQMGGA